MEQAVAYSFGAELYKSLSLDLAYIGIGTFLGTEFSTTLRSYPYPSSAGGNCDKCHLTESAVNFVAKDLSLQFHCLLLDEDPKDVVLLTFAAKLTLFKFCLFKLENHAPCGDRCCPPGVVCGADKKCKDPALCSDGCCSDNDCTPPMKCQPTTTRSLTSMRHRFLAGKQCQCPFACCGDECPSGEFCDAATHQCTNDSHVSID